MSFFSIARFFLWSYVTEQRLTDRICPGAHIANTMLWVIVASVLSTFNISKPIDENGVVVEPNMEYHSAVTL